MLLRKRNTTTPSTNGHVNVKFDETPSPSANSVKSSSTSTGRGGKNVGRGRPKGSTGIKKTPKNGQTPKVNKRGKRRRNSDDEDDRYWNASDDDNGKQIRHAKPSYSTSAELYALEDEQQYSDDDQSTTSDDEASALFLDNDCASTSMTTGTGRHEEDEEDEIFCPWIELEAEQIPPLQLPDSSIDLLIESDFLLETLEIYEMLQNFHSIVQLSPFLFEDFCCALRNAGQSKLLCEIHIALLRLFFREEEQNQTQFSTNETRPSFYLTLHLLDHMTYAEVLRHYVESDEGFSREVLDILENNNYPFVPIEKRLVVLKWMCAHFLETNIFKKALKMGDKIKHDKNCRRCGKVGGDLFPCTGCEAAFHSNCADFADQSNEMELDDQQKLWFCQICRLHQVRGATDCILPNQTGLRKLPLGYDRNGRIYWFLVRRLFIYTPSSNEVYYYSTLPQLYELICCLDSDNFERRLCTTIKRLLPFIAVQMHNTLEATDQRRQQLQQKSQKELAEPYLHVNNANLMSKIMAKIKEEMQNGIKCEMEIENIKKEVEEENEEDDEENEDILQIMRHLLCIKRGKLEANFWSGGLDEHQLLLDYKIWSSAMEADADSAEALTEELNMRLRRGIRLGFSDGGHRNYVNFYCTDELAKASAVRAKERDRKRYLSTRFCLTDEGEFTWPNQKGASPFGTEQEVTKCIQLSLRRLVERLPDGLMHQRWLGDEKQRFLLGLQQCDDIETLRNLMLIYAKALRTPTFINIWWSGFSIIKFVRLTAEIRELKQKIENSRRRETKTLTTADPSDMESGIVWVKSTLTTKPNQQILKMRDGQEQYRINGIGNFGGWLWISPNLVRPFHQSPLNIAHKKNRLRRIANKLLMWRTVEELGKPSKQLVCYSSNCRLISQSSSTGVPVLGAFCPFHFSSPMNQGFLLPCYNPKCARNQQDSTTSHSAKAKSPNSTKQQFRHHQNNNNNIVKPFPFPKPFNFTHKKSGNLSILVLSKWCLKRLARQSQEQIIVPGFTFNKMAIPRPIFDYGWHFLTTKAHSLHALALRFRQMYSSIRWMDLWPEDPDDPDSRIWNHTADYDEVRTVVGHYEHPPQGYYEQYRIRVDQYPLGGFDEEDLDEEDTEFGRPQRKKSRKKQKTADDDVEKRMKAMKTVERWIDGVDLKLFEIAEYWHHRQAKRERLLQQQQAIKAKNQQPTPKIIYITTTTGYPPTIQQTTNFVQHHQQQQQGGGWQQQHYNNNHPHHHYQKNYQ